MSNLVMVIIYTGRRLKFYKHINMSVQSFISVLVLMKIVSGNKVDHGTNDFA